MKCFPVSEFSDVTCIKMTFVDVQDGNFLQLCVNIRDVFHSSTAVLAEITGPVHSYFVCRLRHFYMVQSDTRSRSSTLTSCTGSSGSKC